MHIFLFCFFLKSGEFYSFCFYSFHDKELHGNTQLRKQKKMSRDQNTCGLHVYNIILKKNDCNYTMKKILKVSKHFHVGKIFVTFENNHRNLFNYDILKITWN